MNRRNFIFGLGLVTLTPSLLITSCKNKGKETVKTEVVQKYTCPMHPQVIKDKPGDCPICGMELVPVKAATGMNDLTLSDNQIQLANIKTMMVAGAGFTTSKMLNGRLITNAEQTDIISSRYAGRIEKLYVKETGVKVAKGEAVFQIYSEELQTLQQDYLLQQKQAAAFPDEKIYVSLKKAAGNKLKLYGYSDADISRLSKSQAVSPFITVRAASSGVVDEINVSEGQYITEGSTILKLQNFNSLWVEADLYPNEANKIRIGQTVKVRVDGDDTEQAVKINFISPQLDPSTQILKVRAPIINKGTYQPGMQATVLLSSAKVSNGIVLPVEAVIRDGKGAQVWVKTGKNMFASRMVTTGDEDESSIVIQSGLENDHEVVINGGYLLSSEYILKKGTDPMADHHH